MNTIEDRIMEFASAHGEFGADEAFDYCHARKESTLPYVRKVLTRLVESGRLVRLGKGRYMKPDRVTFRPQVSGDARELYEAVRNGYPFVRLCVAEGQWISPLLHHLASNRTLYVEVEKDASELVFEHLKSSGVNAFYKPDGDMVYRYIDLDDRNVIVKNLISEAPLQKIDSLPVPTLEKTLVDIYCDPDFDYLQGSEYVRVAENAMTIFSINRAKLFRYAGRRGVKEELEKIYKEL